ncbi:MAG TPA: sigma 54-interacting transcriptional regulator [Negativicutes bacterium]|jgi:transcriptional regulator of aroF, aroG, tyrA and aromatic amino acid transport
MDTLRLRIPNVDRVGLVLDISQVLAARHININAMEVERNVIYLEIEQQQVSAKLGVMDALRNIPQVIGVFEIDLLPHQEKAEQLKAVLASVGDGIIAVDHRCIITQYNPAAEKIIRIPACHVIGKPIIDVFPPHTPLLNAVKYGTYYDNCEIILESTNSHYLTSGRPIMDQDGHIIGAVAVLKDISDVRELVYSITGQLSLSFGEILYASQSMQQVITMSKAIARGDSTVLIRGETGTGKELFARAIHTASPRAHQMFVPLNCSAIPDALLESELFGYKDGAFTGASKGGKQGLFEFANNGTIFLDEIGEISPHLQAKLLRVLQEGKIRRIGDNREIAINARILAATNRNLEEMISKGSFREDLYYRLNVIPLFIPPLKARKEDIPLLAESFLQRFAIRLQKPISTFSNSALQKLTQYHWPGNIRELENVIERAVNIVNDSVLLAEHIIFDHDYTPQNCPLPLMNRTLDEIVAEVERETLVKAIRSHKTLRQLGAFLGLSHTAVLKKLRKYDLVIPKKE